jgi:phage terminase large subunit GpA-like protein
MIGQRPDFRKSGGRLPAFVSPAEIVAQVIDGLRPPERLGVEEVATRSRKARVGMQWQAWDASAAPYMSEPQDIMTSRRYQALAFCGPAQSLKTSAIIENAIAHAIAAQPRAVHVVQMDRISAQAFSHEKISPMITHSPDLAARRMPGRQADNIFTKTFLGGMRLSIGWPTASSLSSRAIPLVLLTDYDRMADNIDGEGSAWGLARNRPVSFGSLGMVAAESSPGRDVIKDRWQADTIHEAPPCGGILGIYNQGTRARWHWRCSDCAHEFEPRLDRLKWPDDLTPHDAGAAAVLVCPECGSIIEPAQKRAMNAAGRWLHEAADGARAVPLGDLDIRRSDIATYWMQGAAAALSTWAGIVSQYVAARRAFDDAGDVDGLRAVMNTAHAIPFRRPARRGETAATAEALHGAAADRAFRVVPQGARLVLAAVDVQGGARARFVVQIEAWGLGGRRWLIDRYEITAPPADAPGAAGRGIDPAKYADDWQALHQVAARAYPVEGAGHALRPVAVAIDSGGEAGVTDLAYAFYRSERAAGRAAAWRLARPVGGIQPGLAWVQTPKRGSKGRAAAADLPLLYIATDRAKDAIAAALGRPEGVDRAYRIPKTAPPQVFREITAEEATPQGWRLRKGEIRNEALDLAVYALGLATVLKADRLAVDAGQAWAIEGPRNAYASALARPARVDPAAAALGADPAAGPLGADPAAGAGGAPPAPIEGPPIASPPRRGRRIRGRSNFLSR